MNKPTYTISELSKHFDLTTRTIRFYESEGLLLPERENSKRIYHDRDLVRLKLILRGKRLGFSLAEIKTTLTLYDTQPDEVPQLKYVLETIALHRRELIQKRQDIADTISDMETVAERIQIKLTATRDNIDQQNRGELTEST